MSIHIQAGKKKATICYFDYLVLLKKISIAAKPVSEPLFNVVFADMGKSRHHEWEELYRILPDDIARFFAINEKDTVNYAAAMSVAPLLNKIGNLDEPEKRVCDVIKHARRYRANIHIR